MPGAATRLAASDLSLIDPLIRAYPFKPYRNYRILSRRVQDAVMSAEIASAIESPDGIVLRSAGGHEAAVVLKRLAWDSGFWGIPMARLDYILRADPDDRQGLDEVLRACVEHCRAEGIRHVTARIDVGDTQAIAALEDHGFRLMEALVTYVHRPRDGTPPPVREMGIVRPFRSEDTEQVMAIAAESYRGFRGRFHLDPHMPEERCDALYLEWARQCCGGRMADEVLVSENRQGELYGFLAVRRREPVSAVGRMPIVGGGLGACRRDTPGAYLGLISECIIRAHARGWVSEGQTQNYNFPTVRVYESAGATYVRADYTFHGWFGPAD